MFLGFKFETSACIFGRQGGMIITGACCAKRSLVMSAFDGFELCSCFLSMKDFKVVPLRLYA